MHKCCSGLILTGLLMLSFAQHHLQGVDPVPDKVVVLTFDDSVRSQFDIVRPILKQYGFGATFFITTGFEFESDKQNYMTWEQIRQLHEDGFEIGNHTRDHVTLTAENHIEQLGAVNKLCEEHGIPKPVSFAYPGNTFDLAMLPWLSESGIRFARRGGSPEYTYDQGIGVALEPGFDHPLLIPSVGDARPDWIFDDFLQAVMKAECGKVAVLQFHGVPDKAHDWVSTPEDAFRAYMNFLKVNKYRVIALRDLDKYISRGMIPRNPLGVIEDRQSMIEAGQLSVNYRTPQSRKEMQYWFSVMRRHQFTVAETRMATGLNQTKARDALERSRLPGVDRKRVEVLPYPGGRHPRIGFRDGEIRPQRETKVSVFSPWDDSDYVVLDIPEAIWNITEHGRELFYLAHTHIPTMWDRQGIPLEPVEWTRERNGLISTRIFPNAVRLETSVWPQHNGVKLEMLLVNDSVTTLKGLVTQNCAMLAAMKGFQQQTTDNKIFTPLAVACGNQKRDRWIIYGWQRCQRGWGSELCPCLHSDPQFPDIPPGGREKLRGWISFYEGTDIKRRLDDVNQSAWLNGE
ncbi:MAG: polysaccharide deacetylase family protein [Planctomycetota bacterium]|nr:polysaccharide deacetylase family protein [Planctomycetota bacterium]